MARVWSWRLLALLPFATDTLGQSRHYNARQRFQTKEVEDPVQAPPDYRTKTDDFFMEEGHGIHILDDTSFDTFIQSRKKVLVMYYAPWCHHSKEAKEGFIAAGDELMKEQGLDAFGTLAAINCHTQMQICQQHQITGLPSFKFFVNGKFEKNYMHMRSMEGFLTFLENPDAPPPPPPPPLPELPFSDQPHDVVILGGEDNALPFDDFMQSNSRVFVMFHASWCPHSKDAKPSYMELAAKLKTRPELGQIAAVDCHNNEKLCNQFQIKGLPTFKFFFSADNDPNDRDVLEFAHVRSTENFLAFIQDPRGFVPVHTEL